MLDILISKMKIFSKIAHKTQHFCNSKNRIFWEFKSPQYFTW